MQKNKLLGMVIMTMLLLVVFGLVAASASDMDAGPNPTATPYSIEHWFLPIIRGINLSGATPTPTDPPPTRTPWVTLTPTTTITPTSTNTPTATATGEFQLPPPTLYPINNADGDGNYTVTWSAVQGATRYFLKENFNNTTWEILYDGPGLSINRINMPLGNYCYNVRAFGSTGRSDWAGEQCTTVKRLPEYSCSFETIYEGPRVGTDIELLHDGRVFITETSENGASIFDPRTRSIEPVELPQGGGPYAAVLDNGNVLLTVAGDDSHSMTYNPYNGEITRLEQTVNCLETYAIFAYLYPPDDSSIITYCGDNHGTIYFEITNNYFDPVEYWIDIETTTYRKPFIKYEGSFRDAELAMISNGIVANWIAFDSYLIKGTGPRFDHQDELNPPRAAISATNHDTSKLYFSGGEGVEYLTTTEEAYAVDLVANSFKQIADMNQDRRGHAMTGLTDGSMMVLGGYTGNGTSYIANSRTVEIFVPTKGQWFDAGPLNVVRKNHEAIQLLNGEIFVFGGDTVPGPGYGFNAPTEIGRCELTD